MTGVQTCAPPIFPVLLPSSELCSESKITATWRVPRSLLLATPQCGGAIGVAGVGVDLGFGRGANKEVGVDLFRARVAVDAIFLATAGVDTAVAIDDDAVEVDATFAAVDGAIAVAAVDAIFAASGAAVGAVGVDTTLTAVDGAIAVAAVDAIFAASGAAVQRENTYTCARWPDHIRRPCSRSPWRLWFATGWFPSDGTRT